MASDDDHVQIVLASEYEQLDDVLPVIISIPVEGAIEPGTRVRKINSELGDFAPNGTEGVILSVAGSHPEHGTFYFVQWVIPKAPPIGVIANKVEVI